MSLLIDAGSQRSIPRPALLCSRTIPPSSRGVQRLWALEIFKGQTLAPNLSTNHHNHHATSLPTPTRVREIAESCHLQCKSTHTARGYKDLTSSKQAGWRG